MRYYIEAARPRFSLLAALALTGCIATRVITYLPSPPLTVNGAYPSVQAGGSTVAQVLLKPSNAEVAAGPTRFTRQLPESLRCDGLPAALTCAFAEEPQQVSLSTWEWPLTLNAAGDAPMGDHEVRVIATYPNSSEWPSAPTGRVTVTGN